MCRQPRALRLLSTTQKKKLTCWRELLRESSRSFRDFESQVVNIQKLRSDSTTIYDSRFTIYGSYMSELSELYQQVILDHNKWPRNRPWAKCKSQTVPGGRFLFGSCGCGKTQFACNNISAPANPIRHIQEC